MEEKNKYYSIDRILSTKSTFNLLIGQRSNGKSFQVKRESVKEAFLGLGDLIYLRRWDLELKQDDVTDYFRDCPVSEITGGEYNCIDVFRKRMYLSTSDEEGNIERGRCIGRCASLSSAEHLKSVIQRGQYKNIIYEEMCTTEGYIRNEPNKLMQFVATVFGVQYTGRVWLIGNTISRYNPYFYTWQLRGIQTMKPGDLELYEYTDNETGNKVTLAVEFCSSITSENTMFFGDAAAQITTGVWETESQPAIPENFGPFKVVYKIFLKHESFYFILKVIQNKMKEYLLLVAPGEEKDGEHIKRKLLDTITGDPLSTERLIPLLQGDKVALELMKRGKVVFANNLTGTDYKTIIKNRKIV